MLCIHGREEGILCPHCVTWLRTTVPGTMRAVCLQCGAVFSTPEEFARHAACAPPFIDEVSRLRRALTRIAVNYEGNETFSGTYCAEIALAALGGLLTVDCADCGIEFQASQIHALNPRYLCSACAEKMLAASSGA